MSSNYYAWKDLEVIVIIIALLPFVMLPVFLIFESIFAEVNAKLPPAKRFSSKKIGEWWGILTTNGLLVPESRARRTLGCFLTLRIALANGFRGPQSKE